MWTSQGLNLGPPDYENDKMIFCDSLFLIVYQMVIGFAIPYETH